MDARPAAFGEDPWIAHAQALGRLAAGLVRDDEALDLVQETWLRAGAEPRSLPWLKTVLRNLARDRARARARREHTERAAARTERVPSSAEIVAELELAQRLAREVAALEEPYRLALHLRYFENLAPEEIAARCRLPLETTRTQLRRGLALLRERMDGAHGGERRAWARALLPLARRAATPSALTTTATTLITVMSTKLVSSAAAVILAGLGLFLWQRGAASRREPEPARTAGAETSAALGFERALPAAPAEPLASAREPSGSVERAPSAAPAAPLRSVTGTVVIVDEEGEELEEESGTLSVATGTSQKDYQLRDVPFEEGQFRVELRPGDWIAFGKLVARGREAVLPEAMPVVPGDQPLRVRGQWLKRGRIRVIDAVTRRELSGIDVRCAKGWRANPEWTHPGDDARVQTVVSDGTSPIDLPDRSWLTPYWVHAPGHAWARIDFDHKLGGERTIELSPLWSAVTVRLQGAVPADARVRLYPREGTAPEPHGVGGAQVIIRHPPPEERPSWLASVSVKAGESGSVRIEDFQGGSYFVALEVGEYEDRLRLGSAEVEVPEGGEAAVTVAVDASLLDVPRTHLSGTIRVPPGFPRAFWWLRLERLEGGEKDFVQRLEEMSFHRGEEDVLRWDAGPVRTGRYLASLSGVQQLQIFETRGAGQETELDLELPPPVTVRVEVVDRATGAALEAEVGWHGARLPGIEHFSMAKVPPDPESGAFQFVAARGSVEVSARLEGYLDASQELELRGPTETCRFELERSTGVRLEMREGEASLPVGFEYFTRVRILGADGTAAHVARGSRGSTSILPLEPGRYTLTFPPLEGFEPLEPRTVEVTAGELVEVEVQAVRRR